MCRQQDIGARCVPARAMSATGSTASAQAGAVKGVPIHRMLTKAIADAGNTDCASSKTAQSIQMVCCKRRDITSLFYPVVSQNVPIGPVTTDGAALTGSAEWMGGYFFTARHGPLRKSQPHIQDNRVVRLCQTARPSRPAFLFCLDYPGIHSWHGYHSSCRRYASGLR